MDNQVYSIFFTIIVVQLVMSSFLGIFGIGTITNLKNDLPDLSNAPFISWNTVSLFMKLLGFVLQSIFFSFVTYESGILILISLLFNVISWLCVFLIFADIIHKYIPTLG